MANKANTLGLAVISSQNIKERDYWLKKLAGDWNKSRFPYDSPLDISRPQHIESLSLAIKDPDFSKILKFSNQSDIRLYIFLVTSIMILLHKTCSEEDLIIGAPLLRQQVEGELINSYVALRAEFREAATFKELLLQVKTVFYEAMEHQDYPFETLLYKLNLPMAENNFPLFDVAVLLTNIHDPSYIAPTHPNIIFSFEKLSDCITATLKFNGHLYFKESMERLAEHYRQVIKQVLTNINLQLNQLNLLSESERNKILIEFNRSERDYNRGKTIAELFQDQVAKTPDYLALVDDDRQFSYRELNRNANKLAGRLAKRGVLHSQVIALLFESSAEMMMAILAVIKAGAVYLPISPDYPAARKKYMLSNACAAFILMAEKFFNQNGNGRTPALSLERELSEKGDNKGFSWQNPVRLNAPSCPAYIMYTSGTTGIPNGVIVEHRQVTNLLHWFIATFPMNSRFHVLQLTSYTFDPSVEEIFATLCSGSVLFTSNKSVIFEKDYFGRFVDKYQIEMINFVPSLIKELLEAGKKHDGLKVVISGGESLAEELKNQLLKLGYRLFNHCGLIETTVDSLTDECSSMKVSIGRPIFNTRCYILDKKLNPVPVGVVGELCIAGQGVSRGYLNQPERTAEKYINLPGNPGEIICRTGDLAKWQADGKVELIGRKDSQVKIMGHRIELQEIEKVMQCFPAMVKTLVIVREGIFSEKQIQQSEERFLIAYFVAHKSLDETEVRNYLSTKLPEFMIPAYFYQLEGFPLNSHGKVDWRKLPIPDHSQRLEEIVKPKNKIESQLLAIWSDVLNIKREEIGVNRSFFELGGHSLKATHLISKIHKILEVKLSLIQIFKTPVIRDLALFIQQAKKEKYFSIEPMEKKEYYELSSAQKRLFILQQMELGNTSYNITEIIILETTPDRQRINHAFQELIRRHQSLRTYFLILDNQPVQIIRDEVVFEIEYFDLEKRCSQGGEDSWQEEMGRVFIRPFSLEQAPLMRVALVRLKADKHLLIVDMHHIISDGLSHIVLVQDFIALYEGLPVKNPRIRYSDFSQWQKQLFYSEELKKQKQFWLNLFSGEIPVLNLPLDFPRPAIQSFEGKTHRFELGTNESQALKNLAIQHEATLYMTLLAFFDILLYKVSGQNDIVIGTPVAGRRHADIEDIIGMFVNTLALRNFPSGDKKFAEFLHELKINCLHSFENQDCQYEELIEHLKVTRDASRNPLFDVMFIFQNISVNMNGAIEKFISGMKLSQYEYSHQKSKFDLTLTSYEAEQRLIFAFEYGSKLFKPETIERFGQYFLNIINHVLKNPNSKIADLEIVSQSEEDKILNVFNRNETVFESNKTLSEYFRDQSQKTPDQLALIFQDQYLTYDYLNRASDQLAGLLRKKGVGPNRLVAVIYERSPEMILCIFAILKAGGAYLPIDPHYPGERIRYMLADSDSCCVLQAGFLWDKNLKNEQSFTFKNMAGQKEQLDNLGKLHSPTDLVYVIYTSGSTGKPKGSLLEQGSVVNRLLWMQLAYPLTKVDIILQKTPFVFDVSVWELIWWSMTGASLCQLADGQEKNPQAIVHAVEKYRVSTLHFVPSMLNAFLEYVAEFAEMKRLGSLKRVFSSGEELTIQQVKHFYQWLSKTGASLINLYGPTETAVDISYYDCSPTESLTLIPIGKPIANMQLFVVSGSGHFQPVGIAGELCISGIGVGRGYLNNPELTAEKFCQLPAMKNKRMYRTGDLSRWKADGNIEFLGRLDSQVKIRGFRIELLEIERRIRRHPGIQDAVVIAKTDKTKQNFLIAYVISTHEPDFTALKNDLAGYLPEYMIPAYFYSLKTIPLTATGKRDLKALPELLLSPLPRDPVFPRDEIEKKLVDMWSDILDIDSATLSIDDNFFERGGHSLKATLLLSRIHRQFTVKISLGEIFKTPTIRGLAVWVKQAIKTVFYSINPIEKKEYYECSSGQLRMFFMHLLNPEDTSYHMPLAYLIEGKLDLGKLEDTFKKLIDRHESLRTGFRIINKEPCQIIHPAVDFVLAYWPGEEKDIELIFQDFARPFAMSRPPLMRAGVIALAEDKFILLVDIHHIITDAISNENLMTDFQWLYSGKALAPIRTRYIDFALWQGCLLKSAKIQAQKDYWLARFTGGCPRLRLATDFTRPAKKSFSGATLYFDLNPDLCIKIKYAIHKEEVTLFIYLITAFYIMLARLSEQEDLIVGIPATGRSHGDLEETIGMFINMLPLRCRPEKDKTFRALLMEVKESVIGGFENQDYPFEKLVTDLGLSADLEKNPIFDAVFAMQSVDVKKESMATWPANRPLSVKPYAIKNELSPFDMILGAFAEKDQVIMNLTYATSLFKRSTAEKIARNYCHILQQVLDKPGSKLGEILLNEATEKINAPVLDESQTIFEF